MSFDHFLADLETSGAIEGACLSAQVFLTIFIIINLYKNANKFPIKQLSPICTMAALISFLIINIITVIARQIEQANGYYIFDYSTFDDNCGQCRIYQHTALQYLALVYASLRDFPLIIFSLKTMRVSLCFVGLKKRDLSACALLIFKNEWRIIGLSFFYSLLIFTGSAINLNYNSTGISAHSAQLTFQLLCPKQSGILDWVITGFRYIMLIYSYALSIKTYKQLDFKRFLFLIFLLSNTQVLMRVILLFCDLQNTTYHQFYYHSLLLNLLGTLILFPYSNFNLNVNQPPGAAVLENFQAFINYIPGREILKCFATFRDTEENCQKYAKCFEACLQIRKIKMEVTLQNSLLNQRREQINFLLGNSQVIHFIDASEQIKDKIAKQTIHLQDIKKLQKQLVQFCQIQIFKPWKKTFSRQYVEMQFRQNMIIDQKMKQMGIQIGS